MDISKTGRMPTMEFTIATSILFKDYIKIYNNFETTLAKVEKIFGKKYDIKKLKAMAAESIYTLQELADVLSVGVTPDELDEMCEIVLEASRKDLILLSFGLSKRYLHQSIMAWKNPNPICLDNKASMALLDACFKKDYMSEQIGDYHESSKPP